MKKLLILTAIFCVCFQAIKVSAATPDFSGEWELEINKSILPEAAGIESLTMKVSQTAKEITIQTGTRSNIRLAGGATKQGNATKTIVYNLDGTEKKTEIDDGIMPIIEARKAKITADGKLSVIITHGSKNETAKPEMKSSETWELLDNGNALKIVRYTETPRGGMNFELYFTKKIREGIATRIGSAGVNSQAAQESEGNATEKNNINTASRIAKKGEPFDVSDFKQGGILNFFAYSLTRPEYPKAARAVRAEGAVLVRVTVDEKGDVISASATSGHPLLRQAAEKAAQQSKFNPPTNQGQPAKVTGILIYNFVA